MMKLRKRISIPTFPVLVFAACLLIPPLHATIKTEEIPELKPPQGVIRPEVEKRPLWPLVIAGVGLVVGLALMMQRPTITRAGETPFTNAMRELNNDQTSDAVAIGSVVRRYILLTFPTPGAGQTFEELAALLSSDSRWTPALRERLRQLIDPVEIAKFAPPGNPTDLKRLRDDAVLLLKELEALIRPPVISPA